MEFYNKKILDAPIVKQKPYEKRFLQGKMFGPYSFINVTNGKEAIDDRHSTKNIIEVAVVMEIVAMLFKGNTMLVKSWSSIILTKQKKRKVECPEFTWCLNYD